MSPQQYRQHSACADPLCEAPPGRRALSSNVEEETVADRPHSISATSSGGSQSMPLLRSNTSSAFTSLPSAATSSSPSVREWYDKKEQRLRTKRDPFSSPVVACYFLQELKRCEKAQLGALRERNP